MEIRILGPLDVADDDGSLPLPRGRARALLAILALNPGQVISTDRLLDMLWGASPPPTARTKLHGLVSTLRRALSRIEPTDVLIETRSPGYVLSIPPDRVDAIRFKSLVLQSADRTPSERIEVLEKALDLWRGPALADFLYEPFAQAEITAYESLRVAAIEERIAAELEVGRHSGLVPELEALISEHPYRERLRELAMLAHYRTGNQREALQLARDTHVTFTEELGVEPRPELRELEQAILDHDPGLKLHAGQPGASTEAASNALLSESLRTVTIAFVDVDHAALSDPDPEKERAAARHHHEAVSRVIKSHGGSVLGSIGGVTVAVFGLPLAHEDDVLRAARASMDLVSNDAPGHLRIGISTGEIVIGQSPVSSSLSGRTTRSAAHLQQAAQWGEVLLSDDTRRLLGAGAVVESWLGRIPDNAPAWRLVRLEPRPSLAIASASPWVGREEELALLTRAGRRAAQSSRPVRVAVIGDAGMGKSRLAAEFAGSLGPPYRVLSGRCPPYGDGITFWPLREVVQAAAGGTRVQELLPSLEGVEDAEATAAQLAGVVGSNEYPGRPDELFPAVRRFFEAITARDPLVVVLDDLHWAQPTFIDLVEYLADSVDGPLLLLCLARPEFLELRPSWQEDEPATTLHPLDRRQVEELVERGLVDNGLPYERAPEIIDLAEGNPLFIEQMLAALGENDDLTIPRSLQALLAARLDRLGPAERDLVRAGSVWGSSFHPRNLVEFLPSAVRSTVPDHLEALEHKKMLMRTDDGAFTFRHALIQRAAYRTVTKDTRARLHERVAGVLESAPDRSPSEVDEMVGYHLEQASVHRSELGIDDDHTQDLARRAGVHLSRAGARAFRRLDAVAAERLLTRTLRLLPHDHPEHPSAVRYLVESHQVMGRHDEAGRLLDDLINEVAATDERVLEAFLRIERVWTRLAIGPDPMSLDEIEGEVATAENVFTKAGYDLGLAQIGRARWHLHLRRGEMTDMERAAYRSLEYAGRSASGRERLGAEWGVAMALEEGPRPASECIERCERLKGPIKNPGLASTLAYLHAMQGDFVSARGFVDEALQILREHVRARRPLAQVKRRAGDVELLAGRHAAAEDLLRESLELNREQGERELVTQVAADLARLLVRQSRIVEASDLAAVARDHAPSESVTAQAVWRTSQALVSAFRGIADVAEQLARDAIDLVPPDMLTLRANIMMDSSVVLARAGQEVESAAAAKQATRLFEEKGNHSGVELAGKIHTWL